MARDDKMIKSGKKTRAVSDQRKDSGVDFGLLVTSICQVDESCAVEAGKAVSIALTLRNWLVGLYNCEYEQNGSDRAAYGAKLIDALADRLAAAKVGGLAPRTLRQCRQFYLIYPEILQTLSAKSRDEELPNIWQTLSAKLRYPPISGRELEKQADLASPVSSTDPRNLISRLSFSHFVELTAIDNPLKRSFYEVQSMRGSWSVRELKRQIGALYFERSGLSTSPEKLASRVQASVELAEPRLAIRDPYVFEFLGIKSQEAMGESDLEDALLDKLQTFLLELGHGFCFEARQKRILIGESYCFIDLLFYHRILKCHVLIELKVAPFNHEHLGQLNTYVSWFKRNMMTEGDSPPVGLLLCTDKDHALVEYALADLPNRLFVSKYQLELPTPEQLKQFLGTQVAHI